MILILTGILLASSAFTVEAQFVDCSGVPPGTIELFPNQADCSSYWRCDGDILSLQWCGPGLWFNERLNGCDLIANTECRAGTLCLPGIIDYFPDPSSCERYFECYNSNITLHTCPSGLYFNPDEKKCVDPATSNCGAYTTPPPTTPGGVCAGVPALAIVLIAVEGSCTDYYVCTGNSYTIESCAPGYAFDEPRQMCNFPELVPGCESPVTPTPPPDPQGDCEGKPTPSYLPDPSDCQKYIECYNEIGYPMSCPNGLYFDDITLECMNQREAHCSLSTINPPTTSEGWTPSPVCPWPPTNPFDTYPFPGDCTKYLLCEGGLAHVMDCPPGLEFDPSIDECNYPTGRPC